MSFLKNLFGGGGDKPEGGKALGQEEYQGFVITALEMRAGSEFQLCGEVSQEVDGETRAHKFIRADRLMSREQARDAILAKGRQLVDERGANLFDAP